MVQIDGAINPGNSGGPVVDALGRLVGISVAKIRDSGLGFAIPSGELEHMLQGRLMATVCLKPQAYQLHGEVCVLDRLNKVQSTRPLTLQHDGGAAPPSDQVFVAARLVDPLSKIDSVSVHYVRAPPAPSRQRPTAPGRPCQTPKC